MTIRLSPIAAAIASLLACSLLAACGGGGGGGMVRTPTPAPATLPPAPPAPASGTGPCPAPITSDCVVSAGARMFEGRDSRHALRVRTPRHTFLTLGSNDFALPTARRAARYAFAAGTVVESGVLEVAVDNTLASTVDVLADAFLWVNGSSDPNANHYGVIGNIRINSGGEALLYGTVMGDFHNSGTTTLHSKIMGNTFNEGTLKVGFAEDPRSIYGNFRQTHSGTLEAALVGTYSLDDGSSVTTHPVTDPFIFITGRADLAGTLTLHPLWYESGGGIEFYLPTAPASAHVLHADGGVFGQFDRWTSLGLFIEGSLRYDSKDVWFDLTRISVATAMASNGIGSALTLASATNLERLFARTDGLALMAPGSLSHAQHRVLASAGSVLRIEDIAQATLTLDSLSGATHTDALQASLRQGIADPAVGQRLAAMQPGFAAGAWSRTDADGSVSGFDQWLSPRLLVGAQAGQTSDNASDKFGQSTRLSPQAGAYLRWFGDNGWYAGGSAGYAQHTLALDRTIDLARGGQWNAHARHRFSVAGVQGEAGRRLPLAGGTLTPYMALEVTALRSERTIEQGGTGFELALQPSLQAHLGAGLGLRYGRDWRRGDTGWLRLDADARVQRRLADAGDPLRAAYVGVPDLWFNLPGHASGVSGWLDVGVQGGFAPAWRWSFDLARPWAGTRAGLAAHLGIQRSF